MHQWSSTFRPQALRRMGWGHSRLEEHKRPGFYLVLHHHLRFLDLFLTCKMICKSSQAL